MARLELALLGPPYMTLDDQPIVGLAYDKVRALLAYLAIEPRSHGRDALSELLWPGQARWLLAAACAWRSPPCAAPSANPARQCHF